MHTGRANQRQSARNRASTSEKSIMKLKFGAVKRWFRVQENTETGRRTIHERSHHAAEAHLVTSAHEVEKRAAMAEGERVVQRGKGAERIGYALAEKATKHRTVRYKKELGIQ